MQLSYINPADSATSFFRYAQQHGLAIFPIPLDCKAPNGFKNSQGASVSKIVGSWQLDASKDPQQWEQWERGNPGCNWGMSCADSGLIGVEIDPKARKSSRDPSSEQVGFARASQAWADLCASWGLAPIWPPQVRSPSGGQHFYFRAPGIDVTTLRQRKLVFLPGFEQAVIETRVRGFLLVPPSRFAGNDYSFWPGATAPYDAPPQLIAALAEQTRSTTRELKAGEFDIDQFAKLVLKMNEAGAFDERDSWRNLGMVCKAEWGDAGREIWDWVTVPGKDDDDAQWRSYRNEYPPGGVTIDSIFKLAKQFGIYDSVPRTTAAMFGTVAAALDMRKVANDARAGLPVPMLSGRGEAQARLWSPILDAVPGVDRAPNHPEMPETGHPLRDAINAAIPGIVAHGHADALAVIEAVHPQTAAAVGTITPAIKARAEALRQDAEHALAPTDYQRDHKGEIQRDNIDNMRFFLRSLDVEVRFNQWRERVELHGWEWQTWANLDDTAVAKLRMRASQTGTRFLPGKEFTWDSLLSLAHDNPVDPARDRLHRLESEWDGTPRLGTWLTWACGVPADAYHRAVGMTILLGLVARIRIPGVKFDLMPVFVSERQGTAKSTLARILALDDDWFVENVALGESAKELVLLLAGKSVAEISEMRTRGEVDAVKAMISATHDEARPAYGRAPVNRPRRHIFVGTTNRVEFLEDPTGGRRFLPIVVQGEINLGWVRANIEQLVGEACAMQSRGAEIGLPRDVWEAAGEHQAAATSKSSAEVLLETWFAGNDPSWISSGNLVLLLRQALGREVARGTYTATMGKVGFKSAVGYFGGKTQRVWVRGEPDGRSPGFGPALNSDGRPMLQVTAPPLQPALAAPPLPVR